LRRVVLDASALIVFYRDAQGALTVEQLLRSSLEGKTQTLMSVVNWGEVYYVMRKLYGERVADRILTGISRVPIEIEDATREATMLAAEFKAKYSLPYADCFAASLAKRAGAEIMTSDSDFSVVKHQIPIVFL
jgi:predicted nucleic acid-binding protein